MTKIKQPSGAESNTPKAVARTMLRTLFSTTARIFIPVSVLFAIGLAVDLNTPTKPWGMAVGTGLGIIIAVILVVMQLKSIRQESNQPAPAGGTK